MRSVSRPVLLALAGCGLAVAASAPAAARSCPSGQILQVSKGRCISREAAKKAGIAVRTPGTAAHAAKPKPAKAGKAAERKSGETTVAKSAPIKADETDAPETTVAASTLPAFGFAQSPAEAPSVRRNIAPFGALQFSGFR
ncbi:MAG: hypothetical protein KDJ25_04885 [Rhodoblastus sp.]|nr:hypothetical protein [Rhodoblastus sp.]